MKYFKFVLIALSVFHLQNCGNKDNVDTQLSINTIEIRKDFLLGESPKFQVEILDTINLEVPGNPPLIVVQDIVFSENFLLILDRIHGLLKFDKNGSFIRTIGKKGEGPEEYIIPYAIHLNEKENSVLVADWEKRIVISYDLDGNFDSSSQRLPGHPISFYKENDTILVVQETLNGTKEEPRQVLVSSIEPKTFEVKNLEKSLFGYHSNFSIIHAFPRILSRVNNETLFYLPIIKGEMSSHSNRDTIFRKVDDHLFSEYLLNLTGFDNTLQLGISQVVMSDSYAFLHVVYDYRSYFILIDLENNRPQIHLRQLFDKEITLESMPRQLEGDVFYSILRNEDDIEEKNPMIVLFRLISEVN